MIENNDDATEFQTVPHARCALKMQFAEVLDLIGAVVSPEGIDNGKARPKAEAVLLILSGEPIWRPKAEKLVSPEGIEPSTNRLRVCCSAS